MQAFAGIYAAAITPRSKTGDLDFGAAFELLDHLAKGRVDGIAMFTAAGEYPAFSLEERIRLFYLACKRSRLPVWAGVGSANLDDSLRLAREARSAGAEALLLPPPLLFPYAQDVLSEFYLEFAAQLNGGIPIFVCSAAGSATVVTIETALCLAQKPMLAGVCDASDDADRLRTLDAARGAHSFGLLVDSDRLLGSFPGAGAISACACAVPELAAAVHRGANSEAGKAFSEFVAWSETLPPMVAVKVATGLRGIQTGACAVPLPPRVQNDLDAFRDWFRNWLPAVKRLSANG